MESLKIIKSMVKGIIHIVTVTCINKYKFSYIGEYIEDIKEGNGIF